MVQAERSLGLDRNPSIQTAPTYQSLFDLPLQGKINTIREFGSGQFGFLLNKIFSRSYLPRTVFRHDPGDKSFQGNTWIRDVSEVAAVGVDPFVRSVYSNQLEQSEWLSTEILNRLFAFYGKDEELVRFDQRPQNIGIGYQQRMVPDQLAVTTKATLKGVRVDDWSHNQLDALARFQHVAALAVRLGLPVLQQSRQQKRAPGEIMLKNAAYLAANLDEDIATHMGWEEDKAYTSDSTKMKMIASQKELLRIFSLLEQDAAKKGYDLPINRSELIDSIYTGLRHQTKYFPYDYTAPHNHPNPEDLLQLKAIVDTNPPLSIQEEILKHTQKLEGPHGFVRWEGDPWKRNERTKEHAQWGFGQEYMAMIDADLAMRYHKFGDMEKAQQHLEHGVLMLDRTMLSVHKYKYPRELVFRRRNGQMLPNQNDLAWRRALIYRASARMVTALESIGNDVLAA